MIHFERFPAKMHYFIWTNVAFVSVGFVAATNWTNLDHSL